MVQQFSFLIFLFALFGSCSQQTGLSKSEREDLLEDFHEKQSEEQILRSRILGEFEVSVSLLPVVPTELSEYLEDGLLYEHKGKRPFTGRIRDFYDNGSVSLDATFLNGEPHGVHTRRFDNGNIYWEALYNFGVLCGTKITAYESGLIAQKEYWKDGQLLWRKNWDDRGRLIREEKVRSF